MDNTLKATHNSATGEKSYGLSTLLVPFARCQSKTISEQYASGCSLFDIRIKDVVRKGKTLWVAAHGLWKSKRTVPDMLGELNALCEENNTICYVSITYEGRANTLKAQQIKELYHSWIQKYTNIVFLYCAVKYGEDAEGLKVNYDFIEHTHQLPFHSIANFKALDGTNWQTYIPIPWLWDRIYSRPHKFNKDFYIYVDFL